MRPRYKRGQSGPRLGFGEIPFLDMEGLQPPEGMGVVSVMRPAARFWPQRRLRQAYEGLLGLEPSEPGTDAEVRAEAERKVGCIAACEVHLVWVGMVRRVAVRRSKLAELDSESELLRILASDVRNRPQVLTAAAEELVSSTLSDFAGWIEEEADRAVPTEEAKAIAVFGGVPVQVDDETLVDAWVQMMDTAMAKPIQTLPTGDPG